MNIIIVGAGRVGSQLAVLLSRNGHNVSVVDKDQSAFRTLGRDFNGRTVKGQAFDEDVLVQAGIEECDVLTAVTNRDNTNLMTAEVARRIFNVPRVITRLYNPDRAEAYSLLGLDYVCGTTLVSEEMFAKIESGVGHHIETFGDFEILTFSLALGSENVEVSSIEREGEVRIALVEHEGASLIPRKDTVLHDGDQVVAIVRTGSVEHMSAYIRD